MSSLTDIEKRYFEKLLVLEPGYVLDYNNQTFGDFFNRYNISIHDQKYQTHGTSKVKKMRAFWTQEPDALVGKVLDEMLNSYEFICQSPSQEIDAPSLQNAREIVARLLAPSKADATDDDFLQRELSIPSIQKLPIEASVVPIIESSLKEAKITMGAGAYLSTIFLCGSVLEAVLLGAAQKEPSRFNRASASPKASGGSVKRFRDWNLAQLIDVAHEVGLLKPDIKKFSHSLRDFRNYIHPYEQISSGFSPDEHTAKLCLQALTAALADVARERK